MDGNITEQYMEQDEDQGIEDDDEFFNALDMSDGNYIHKSVDNLHNITLMLIFKIISEYLIVEVTSHVKATLTLITKLICDDMTAYPLVIALGHNLSWRSIPVAVKKEMCTSPDILETEHKLQELLFSGDISMEDCSLISNQNAMGLNRIIYFKNIEDQMF
ncbi:hypothetical protein PHYBLDRAFT_58444 [Phycomyces blakesleeanus NRRL 1555(-)]|uniref:Uncharacterized protein n=1 Tax=Phycomyces blakesleeanus (strain ATCC 8743b / DSM 1359 / FGSC 10004 / NBRC 33097 / NRRL 1555) TaxID=763407 RepID=A0A167QAY8_PHYB8|nr:hypothetical protein PHYBLDRAFT_58444 [Phycomyces blakesleeanus NRRL 1555(-)]OAD79394.1 hypothetical protein PHYBLDRAFT_58444 [Phycomyces blakesleeanus NRRL 1555(-)]|eukprot:XP_018297434.1 hypothetical protein PHYBLDRAFT_58444 [Phycomyces blakesleeanus NRRL 1555(-)]